MGDAARARDGVAVGAALGAEGGDRVERVAVLHRDGRSLGAHQHRVARQQLHVCARRHGMGHTQVRQSLSDAPPSGVHVHGVLRVL